MERTEALDSKRTLLCLLLVLAAVLSFFPGAKKATDPETYTATMEALDDRCETVMMLSASLALASAGITALPGDTGTPVAEKLSDFTEYFLLILCVLYAEKYLLTVMGGAACKILIPALCACLLVDVIRPREALRRTAWKLAVLAMALLLALPVSLRISDQIYETCSVTVQATLEESEEFSDTTDALTEAEGDKGLIATILTGLKETAVSLGQKAAKLLNSYVESLAVLIVTSCIIPVLVLLFFLWLVKVLFGVDVPLSIPSTLGRRKK